MQWHICTSAERQAGSSKTHNRRMTRKHVSWVPRTPLAQTRRCVLNRSYGQRRCCFAHKARGRGKFLLCTAWRCCRRAVLSGAEVVRGAVDGEGAASTAALPVVMMASSQDHAPPSARDDSVGGRR